MVLTVALKYGGRANWLTPSTRSLDPLRKKASNGNARSRTSGRRRGPSTENLYTAGLPDPDLLTPTPSGECAISNFLLWQIAYAEIYVTDTLWPDFRREETLCRLADYQTRERRYGVWLRSVPKCRHCSGMNSPKQAGLEPRVKQRELRQGYSHYDRGDLDPAVVAVVWWGQKLAGGWRAAGGVELACVFEFFSLGAQG